MARKPKDIPRGVINVRTGIDTSEILKELAFECGYLYSGEGATGELLDAIAALAKDENKRLILLGLLKKAGDG